MQRTTNSRNLVQAGLLIAIMTLLAVTPLGFISVGIVSITIMHIPVIIGGVTMGPKWGGILGATFGILSMAKASGFFGGVLTPTDLLFSPFYSGNWLATIIMAVVPRILLGVIVGWLFILLRKYVKKLSITILISAVISSVLHTVMVLGLLSIFFSAIALADVFMVVIGINGIIEMIVAAVVSVAICIPLLKIR